MTSRTFSRTFSRKSESASEGDERLLPERLEKPKGGKEMEKKSLKAKILKAWYEQDFNKTAGELLAAADVWKNGSSDGIVVWDTEKEELSVVRESATTYTPSFIYLHRLPGNYKPDIDEEELFFDLKDLDIEDVLEKAID